MPRGLILAAAVAVPAAALAAVQPVALAHVEGGLWELTGVPGSHAPVRQCVADVMMLGQFEHRGKACTRTIVSNKGSALVMNYSCGSNGFGHSEIDVLTPRSLRVVTQGISDQLPFAYTLQAHRVGECGNGVSSRH